MERVTAWLVDPDIAPEFESKCVHGFSLRDIQTNTISNSTFLWCQFIQVVDVNITDGRLVEINMNAWLSKCGSSAFGFQLGRLPKLFGALPLPPLYGL